MLANELVTLDFGKDTVLPNMPDPFIIDGIIHRSQTIIYGQTNVGKSMLAISLASAVANGRDWNAHKTHTSGNVAIVTGDPDGLYENYERLDRIRDEFDGTGIVRVIVPERPMAAKTWDEIDEQLDDCTFMILDNLTQFVPTSLNDDSGVRTVYEHLSAINRQGVAVCVLAHTSDKKNEHGYASNIPLGSSVIRTVPRWFVYLRRASGVLYTEMSGNNGRPWKMTLTEPADTPRFRILNESSPDEVAEEKQQRTQNRLDKDFQLARWLKAHPNLTQTQAAEQSTQALGFNVSQSRVSRVTRML